LIIVQTNVCVSSVFWRAPLSAPTSFKSVTLIEKSGSFLTSMCLGRSSQKEFIIKYTFNLWCEAGFGSTPVKQPKGLFGRLSSSGVGFSLAKRWKGNYLVRRAEGWTIWFTARLLRLATCDSTLYLILPKSVGETGLQLGGSKFTMKKWPSRLLELPRPNCYTASSDKRSLWSPRDREGPVFWISLLVKFEAAYE
jgi:hypothetical protein